MNDITLKDVLIALNTLQFICIVVSLALLFLGRKGMLYSVQTCLLIVILYGLEAALRLGAGMTFGAEICVGMIWFHTYNTNLIQYENSKL